MLLALALLFAPLRLVATLPDVTDGTPYHAEIILLHRAGILNGKQGAASILRRRLDCFIIEILPYSLAR